MSQWVQLWRNTVLAMRSVPGAHFQFEWCVNAAVRPFPLSQFYPGDDVVDIVGIDAYDAGIPAGRPRWSTIYNQTYGIGDVLAFAGAHGKPLSIPEWRMGSDPTTLTAGETTPTTSTGSRRSSRTTTSRTSPISMPATGPRRWRAHR